jgi:carbonic anhydrase
MPIPELRDGHRRFKQRFNALRDVFTRAATESQRPKALWIGCSDSRVVPEIITAADPGDLFIMRNIANIVPPCGMSGDDQTGAVVEFAVLSLRVSNIVVCGHTGCGGIKALSAGVDAGRSPHLARWVELARAAHAAAAAGSPGESDPELATIKANVLLQLENLRTYPCVAEGERAGELALHACLYDLHTGDLQLAGEGRGEWRIFPPI